MTINLNEIVACHGPQRFLDVKVLDEMNSVLLWCHPAVAQAAEQVTFAFFIQPSFKLRHNQ